MGTTLHRACRAPRKDSARMVQQGLPWGTLLSIWFTICALVLVAWAMLSSTSSHPSNCKAVGAYHLHEQGDHSGRAHGTPWLATRECRAAVKARGFNPPPPPNPGKVYHKFGNFSQPFQEVSGPSRRSRKAGGGADAFSGSPAGNPRRASVDQCEYPLVGPSCVL